MSYSIIEEWSGQPERRESPIPLPALALLDFRGTPSQCTTFLSNVVIPANCKIMVKGRITNTSAADINPQQFMDETLSYVHQCLPDASHVDLVVSKALDGVTLNFCKKRHIRDTTSKSFKLEPLVIARVSYCLPESREGVDLFVFPKSIPLPRVVFMALRSSSTSWTPPPENDTMTDLSTLSLTSIELDGGFVSRFAGRLAAHPKSFKRLISLKITRGEDFPSSLEPLYDALAKCWASGRRLHQRIRFITSEGREDKGEFAKWKEQIMQIGKRR
ncbi:hypothetical protein BDN72DRAFT_899305 [Pluteus cervinus]|uniref:Uncharacterized protein n=1 Tax=Pluteus cervinus TaxID=181527 RepID=A0ACD3ANA7_9AGAR|nr:hypothetical protein BDN72DRAFT_899305 [Pluteus cervinus]